MIPAPVGLAFGFQSSAFSRARSGMAYVLPLSISQKTTVPSVESPTCLNRGSSDPIISSPLRNCCVRLRLVAGRSNHPLTPFEVVLPHRTSHLSPLAGAPGVGGFLHW